MAFSWLINGGDPNHLVTGMILTTPNDRFLLGPGLFSWAFAVSFRECKMKLRKFDFEQIQGTIFLLTLFFFWWEWAYFSSNFSKSGKLQVRF